MKLWLYLSELFSSKLYRSMIINEKLVFIDQSVLTRVLTNVRRENKFKKRYFLIKVKIRIRSIKLRLKLFDFTVESVCNHCPFAHFHSVCPIKFFYIFLFHGRVVCHSLKLKKNQIKQHITRLELEWEHHYTCFSENQKNWFFQKVSHQFLHINQKIYFHDKIWLVIKVFRIKLHLILANYIIFSGEYSENSQYFTISLQCLWLLSINQISL